MTRAIHRIALRGAVLYLAAIATHGRMILSDHG